MATVYSIQMDFQQARQQAQRLDDIASQLERIAGNELGGTLQELSIGWKGENATAYIKKGGELQNKMGNSVKNLRNIADSIRRIAKRVYDAEMAAINLVQD
ncbi:MAG: WXG100 family type VII secretion target [Lachnospiraceae bacterium]|nr:WXG100 family type VII secretion target [Lachnospiraceae bacterium]